MLLSSSSTFVWLRKLYKTFKQSRRQIEAELLENDHHRNTETMRKTLILKAKYSVSSYPSYTVYNSSFFLYHFLSYLFPFRYDLTITTALLRSALQPTFPLFLKTYFPTI